jgi:hypothetical protein
MCLTFPIFQDGPSLPLGGLPHWRIVYQIYASNGKFTPQTAEPFQFSFVPHPAPIPFIPNAVDLKKISTCAGKIYRVLSMS